MVQKEYTLKALKYWATSLFTDAVWVWLLYCWQVKGSEGALNALLFLGWALTVICILLGHSDKIDRTTFADNPRPRGFKTYHLFSSLLLLGALAWFGLFWLAGFHLYGLLLMENARTRDPKPKEATP